MRYFLVGLLLLLSFSLSAQELNAVDTVEIQQKAIRHVKQFERLLNLISQPEESFRAFSFDELIRSYYRPGSSRQIFRDSLVVIEDDLNPTAQGIQYRNLLTVKNYLNAFFSLYEKSERPGVSFTHYEVSPVRQDDFIFVEVFYDSKFLSRHQAYPDTPYPVRPRKATVKATRQGLGWQVTLVDISHRRSDGTPGSLANNTQPNSEQFSLVPKHPSASPTTLPVIIRLPPPEVAVPRYLATAMASYSLDSIRRVYRAGRSYSLPIKQAPDSAVLLLYRDGKQVADLSQALSDTSASWLVSPNLDYGDNYQFHLSDPTRNDRVTSSTFAIKRRIPWPIIAGAVGAAVVLVAVISGGNDNGGGEGPSTDELPAPPDPE